MPASSENMPFPQPPVSHKRERPSSTNNLLSLETQPAAKQRELSPHATPILHPVLGEPKASYFRRLRGSIDGALFSAAHEFDRDGLYLYKRPVRSAGNQAALLAAAGSVFHHCVVYVKAGDQLVGLEYGPANAMDVTANWMEEAPAGPVLSEEPALPEPGCLPMLHIGAPHHPVGAEHVQKALRFAQSRPYQALRNNCIAFADFAVRVLTGGSVRSAPLIFDALVGKIPPQDSPMLGFLYMTTQMTWMSICDGSPLTAAFLREHTALPPPPAAAAGTAAAADARPAPGSQGAPAPGGQHNCLQETILAAAAAAAAEAEGAAEAAAAGVRQAAPAARPAPGLAVAAGAGGAGAPVPADSGRSESTEWVGLQRLPSMQSVGSGLLSSSGSSRSLGTAGGARFDPLARRVAVKSKAGGGA